MAPLLKKLYENACKNTSNSRGNRHDETVLQFAASLYCLIGKSGYEMLQSNLGFALPSLSTVQKLISREKKLKEGDFHFDELVEHLNKFNSPLVVNVHLDDTRIIHRIDYDSTTDVYVGFVLPLSEEKLPIQNAFCLQTFEEIKAAFNSNVVAKYAHCIVAQPVSINAPSFVLFVMGTDSKYNAETITQRWNYIENELNRRHVQVLTFGADGAGPFLKAMINSSQLFQRSSNDFLLKGWDFF